MVMTFTDDKTRCLLIGGLFSMGIQLILASVCVATLIVKRNLEVPQREWNVWFFDFLKQGIGSSFGHITNLLISSRIAYSEHEIDECQWYFVVYVTDSTLGMLCNLLLLVIAEKVAQKFHSDTAKALRNCGDYGDPPTCRIFSTQLALWIAIVIVSKVIVIGVLILLEVPLNDVVGTIFDHFEGFRKLELIFVMVVVPFVLNILQFWVQDTFLKKTEDQNYILLHSSDSGDSLLHDKDSATSFLDRYEGGIALSDMSNKASKAGAALEVSTSPKSKGKNSKKSPSYNLE
jgi:hypothetical protein